MTDEPWDDTDTRAACAQDPHLEGMRQLLLKLERDAHKRGWDHEDNQHKLFEVMRGENLFGLRMAEILQTGFDLQCARRDGNVGLALLDVAEAVKLTRAHVTSEEILGMGGSESGDLYSPSFGGEVFGWGLLSETWMLDYSTKDATPEELEDFRKARDNHSIHEHPDRIEGRMVQLVCRDGMHWTVMRIRGRPAKALVQKPESLNFRLSGNVPYALGRMLDAIVANPVPVPSRGADFWKRQGGR